MSFWQKPDKANEIAVFKFKSETFICQKKIPTVDYFAISEVKGGKLPFENKTNF